MSKIGEGRDHGHDSEHPLVYSSCSLPGVSGRTKGENTGVGGKGHTVNPKYHLYYVYIMSLLHSTEVPRM